MLKADVVLTRWLDWNKTAPAAKMQVDRRLILPLAIVIDSSSTRVYTCTCTYKYSYSSTMVHVYLSRDIAIPVLQYCNNMEYWNIRILGKWNIGILVT